MANCKNIPQLLTIQDRIFEAHFAPLEDTEYFVYLYGTLFFYLKFDLKVWSIASYYTLCQQKIVQYLKPQSKHSYIFLWTLCSLFFKYCVFTFLLQLSRTCVCDGLTLLDKYVLIITYEIYDKHYYQLNVMTFYIDTYVLSTK